MKVSSTLLSLFAAFGILVLAGCNMQQPMNTDGTTTNKDSAESQLEVVEGEDGESNDTGETVLKVESGASKDSANTVLNVEEGEEPSGTSTTSLTVEEASE